MSDKAPKKRSPRQSGKSPKPSARTPRATKPPAETDAWSAAREQAGEVVSPTRYRLQRELFREALGGRDFETVWREVNAVLMLRRTLGLSYFRPSDPPPIHRLGGESRLCDADLIVRLRVAKYKPASDLVRTFGLRAVLAAVGIFEANRDHEAGVRAAAELLQNHKASSSQRNAKIGKKCTDAGKNSRSTVEEREQRGKAVRRMVKEFQSEGYSQRAARNLVADKLEISYSTACRDDQEPAAPE